MYRFETSSPFPLIRSVCVCVCMSVCASVRTHKENSKLSKTSSTVANIFISTQKVILKHSVLYFLSLSPQCKFFSHPPKKTQKQTKTTKQKTQKQTEEKSKNKTPPVSSVHTHYLPTSHPFMDVSSTIMILHLVKHVGYIMPKHNVGIDNNKIHKAGM